MSKFRSYNEDSYQTGNYSALIEYHKKSKQTDIPEVVCKIAIDRDLLKKTLKEVGQEIRRNLKNKAKSEKKKDLLNNPEELKTILKDIVKIYSTEEINTFEVKLKELNINSINKLRNHTGYSRWKIFKEHNYPENSRLRKSPESFKFLSIMEAIINRIEKKYGKD